MDKIIKYLLDNGFIIEEKDSFMTIFTNYNISVRQESILRLYVYINSEFVKEFRDFSENIPLFDFIPYMERILRKRKLEKLLNN